MKVILYMAISANGMIAKKDDNTDWISQEEWDSYSSAVRKAGNLIVGRRTYEILTKQPEFVELKDVKLVVVSEEDIQIVDPEHLVARSPKEAIELLKDFDRVIIAGGGLLNASFMAESLVDEIYLDIEPRLLGEGIPLFKGREFDRKLELVDFKKISDNEIQLHYRVLK